MWYKKMSTSNWRKYWQCVFDESNIAAKHTQLSSQASLDEGPRLLTIITRIRVSEKFPHHKTFMALV